MARLTASVNPRHKGATFSAGSDTELMSGAAAAAARSSTVSPEMLSRLQPLSPRQHQQRADADASRLLKTFSMLPQTGVRHEELARAWEGLPQQQQSQQQPLLGGSSSYGDGGAPTGPAGQQQPAAGAATATWSKQQQQWQQLPRLRLGGEKGYEDSSRIYSDEEVRAVAAALPNPLTLQEQRLVADLLRLKRVRPLAGGGGEGCV